MVKLKALPWSFALHHSDSGNSSSISRTARSWDNNTLLSLLVKCTLIDHISVDCRCFIVSRISLVLPGTFLKTVVVVPAMFSGYYSRLLVTKKEKINELV